MRSKVLTLLVVFLGVSLWASIALAQAEEKKAEEQKPQLYVIWDVVVKPSKVVKFDAGVKEEVALYTKYEYPYLWMVSSTNDGHYYFLIQADNLAAADNIFKAFSEAQKKAGEEYQALVKRFVGTYEYIDIGMWYLRPDLSYFPETPRLKEEEVKFLQWSFYYIKVGMEQEAEEIAKKWKALFKSKNISDQYWLWVGFIGVDTPVFCAVRPGKSAADYFSQAEKINQLFGEEGTALMQKTMALCRKFEQKIGARRPDLFYTPKEEKPTE